MSKLWVEKYRPTTINNIISQNDILNSFKNILILKNMPHLLFFVKIELLNLMPQTKEV